MLKYLIRDKAPVLLVVTPLAPKHEVSSETKKTIRRNDLPFTWVSYKSENNCAANAQLGINAFYEENGFIPPFFLLLDNSVSCGRHMLDRMFDTLEKSEPYVAYTYSNFEFKGEINRKFPADPFDVNRLIRANYISSNSMIKTGILMKTGWLVTDDKYKRLLDWCLWLKLLKNGYIGKPCTKAWFVDTSSRDSVSSGDIGDYQDKYNMVVRDFVYPLVQKAREEQKKVEKQKEEVRDSKEDVVKLL